MPAINVKVKWKGKMLENLVLDTDAEDPVEVFKAQLYSQTDVLPERQKIIAKGKILKEDTDLNDPKLQLKEGCTLMLMGTPGEPIKLPESLVQHTEDTTMDEPEEEKSDVPSGLQNPHHICYMNATLQCLRAMPELHAALDRYDGSTSGVDDRGNLTACLGNLYKTLRKRDGESISPMVFYQMLRQTFPQFSQDGPRGIPMQQDAEECWSELLSVLKAKLPSDETTKKGFVDQYMTGQLQKEIKCTESSEEEVVKTTESFTRLNCHITISTNYMEHGITESLKEELEKNSPSLGRNAKYESTSKISRLPQYLPINFVRFFWKPQDRIKAKILRKVKFPLYLDATGLCTPELQQKLGKAKLKLKEVDDDKLQRERDEKRRKLDRESSNPDAVTSKAVAKQEKVDWSEVIDPDLQKDAGCNPSGQYELCAVLTHKGRSADEGHYIAWVKRGDDQWHKFDDDDVTVVRDTDIEKLDGGGDRDMAYIVLYRARKLD